MPARTASLPFVFVRSHQVIGRDITSTTEQIHGVLQFTHDRLRLQWRVARSTEVVGKEIRRDVEVEPVVEAEVPLAALAGAEVRMRWWHRFGFPGGVELVLRASDLRAFEVVAGTAGLLLAHPAELVVAVRPADRVNAREFAAELTLALAEMTDGGHRLGTGVP